MLAGIDVKISAADADMADPHKNLIFCPRGRRALDKREAAGFFADERFHQDVLYSVDDGSRVWKLTHQTVFDVGNV
ncbi:hypothetical protein RvVAR031_38350 [Agrobacterium vitis]|nr:hypothetical protein RvVAR031_38350 [Agrobacterium vitis]